jgi:hypothetical protein
VVDCLERGPAAGGKSLLDSSSLPLFWSGNGEWIVKEKRGLSFFGIAEEQKKLETIGND